MAPWGRSQYTSGPMQTLPEVNPLFQVMWNTTSHIFSSTCSSRLLGTDIELHEECMKCDQLYVNYGEEQFLFYFTVGTMVSGKIFHSQQQHRRFQVALFDQASFHKSHFDVTEIYHFELPKGMEMVCIGYSSPKLRRKRSVWTYCLSVVLLLTKLLSALLKTRLFAQFNPEQTRIRRDCPFSEQRIEVRRTCFQRILARAFAI